MVKYTKTEVMRALKDYSKRGQKWARLLLPILTKEFADKKTDDARNWAIRLSQSIVKSRLPILKLTVDKMKHEDFIKALKKIERKADLYADWWVDVEETEVEALRREFVEETGLTITPLNRIAEASQYFIRSTDEPLNNVGGFWTARVVAEDPTAKCEDDHTLVWLDPTFAVSRLRHDSHAWAVAVWLRRAS